MERAAGVGQLVAWQQVCPDDPLRWCRGIRIPATGRRGLSSRGFRSRTPLLPDWMGRPRQSGPAPVQSLRSRALRRRRRASVPRCLGVRVRLQGRAAPLPKGEEGGRLPLRPPYFFIHIPLRVHLAAPSRRSCSLAESIAGDRGPMGHSVVGDRYLSCGGGVDGGVGRSVRRLNLHNFSSLYCSSSG